MKDKSLLKPPRGNPKENPKGKSLRRILKENPEGKSLQRILKGSEPLSSHVILLREHPREHS